MNWMKVILLVIRYGPTVYKLVKEIFSLAKTSPALTATEKNFATIAANAALRKPRAERVPHLQGILRDLQSKSA